MSCIAKLLELKRDNGVLKLNEGVVLESGGNYRGFDFCVTFTYMGHRCGYVAIPEDHAIAKTRDYLNLDLDVHGGITFLDLPEKIIGSGIVSIIPCNDVWLGFDAAHWMDGRDFELASKYFPESEELKMMQTMSVFREGKIRTNDYMTQQCTDLIDQIVALSEPNEPQV